MGLDMYLTSSMSEAENVKDNEIGDWRKHANLHGYMERLYRERGGIEDSFNCIPLELTKEDCEEIIQLSKDNDLAVSEGFFWGASNEEDNEITIKYMEEALSEIKRGRKIFYNSWW